MIKQDKTTGKLSGINKSCWEEAELREGEVCVCVAWQWSVQMNPIPEVFHLGKERCFALYPFPQTDGCSVLSLDSEM